MIMNLKEIMVHWKEGKEFVYIIIKTEKIWDKNSQKEFLSVGLFIIRLIGQL